jgi:gliding motility-associated-like protein
MKKQLQKITFFSALLLSAGTTVFGQIPSYVPTNGLVGWWPFNGNANDESGNGNNGTVNGATLTTDRFGNTNAAYYFSSSGCATRIDANVNTTSIQTGLTISVWLMNVGNGCLGPRILEFWPGSNGPGMAQWGTDYSQGLWGLGSLTSTGFSCSAAIPMSANNVWAHLVYTNNGNQGKFYKNGVLIATVNSTGNPILASSAAFGRMNHPAYDAYNGKLDDIGIWNRALSDCEVAGLFNSVVTTPPTVDLGSDTLNICGLNTSLDATNPAAASYSWNTGETTPNITVSSSGEYHVTVTDTSGCSSSDTVYVSVIDPTITAGQSAFCFGDSTTLQISPSYNSSAGCESPQSPTLSSWTAIAPASDYFNLIKEGNTYYLRSQTDVFTSSSLNGPWTSLNFSSQIGNTCAGLMLGFDWSNQLFISTCHNDLYALSGTNWVPKGLGGFGCGGNFIEKLNNNRILVMKAGFMRDLYISDNNGANWTNVTNVDNDYWDIVVAENGTIFSCGGSNTPSLTGIIKSSNNGQNWTQINSQLNASVTFVYALEKDCNGNLYAIGNDKIYKSQDNGNTWSFLNNVPALGASYFEVATNGDFYIFINNNGFYKSSDNGATWQLITDFPISLNNIIRYMKQIDDKIIVFTTQGVYAKSIQIQANPIWWSDGTTNQTSIQVQPTQTTTYSVTVSDGVGSCTDNITIQVNNPQINAGSDISVCAGDSTTLTATGASTYAWDNGVVNGQTFVPIVEGYYNVTGTDTLGCSNSVSIFLDLLQPTSSNISLVNCVTYTAPDGAVYTNSGQYTAVIPNNAGCDSTISINLTINNPSTGTETKVACDTFTWIDGVTYTENNTSATYTLQNAAGCDSVVTLNLTINKLLNLNAGTDQVVCKGENVILAASGADTYNWNNGISDGVAFSPPLGTTTYTVSGTDGNGCTDTDEVVVTSDYCFEIPGALSPNGDNNNDTWLITGLSNYPNAQVTVFDRWGQKVYEGSSSSTPWDGKYNGKDLPTADYYYVIELGNGDKYNGVVTLKR